MYNMYKIKYVKFTMFHELYLLVGTHIFILVLSKISPFVIFHILLNFRFDQHLSPQAGISQAPGCDPLMSLLGLTLPLWLTLFDLYSEQ